MGPPGMEFVYKDELRALRNGLKQRIDQEKKNLKTEGLKGSSLDTEAKSRAAEWLAVEETKLAKRYEKELMNPKEALSLGSISQIVMPSDLRPVSYTHLTLPTTPYV